jgi:hypothetical protein
MNIEEPSGICSGLLTLRDHLHHLCPLLRQQLRPAPSNAALVASGFKARPRSRNMARSNSANDPIICIIIRPAGVVVSIAL